MLEFAVELGFQFLELWDGELRDIDYKALGQEEAYKVADLLWPEPDCPCFEAMLCCLTFGAVN